MPVLASSIPEAVTPWLTMVTVFIGMIAAIFTAFFTLRKTFKRAFREMVLEAVKPITEKVAEIGELAYKTADDLTSERMSVARKLDERSKVTDENFAKVNRRLDAINLTTRRATQTVVEKIDSATGAVIDATNPPAANGDS